METFLVQLLALFAFFAFPLFEYIILKFSTRSEGHPQIWYLPAYGFRLVIRNLPKKKKLYDIRYRSLLRDIIPRCSGSSVKTFDDIELLECTDFFYFLELIKSWFNLNLKETIKESLSSFTQINWEMKSKGHLFMSLSY